MSKIDWLERRRRAAHCKIHGLHYDPVMTSGCILCRKEGLLREKPKGPQLIMLLLALLGMAVAIFQIYGPVSSTVSRAFNRTQATVEEDTPASPTQIDKIDPEPFKTAIHQFERALLIPKSDDLGNIREDISTAGQILNLGLMELELPLGQQVEDHLADLLDMVNSEDLDLRNLDKVRQRWFTIRARNFQPARWFLAPTSESDLDRVELVVYREIAYDLQELIADGVRQAQQQQDEAADAEEWSEFLSSWRSEIDTLQQRLPERPGTASDVQLLLVVQQLEQSLEELQRLATASEPPANPSSRFEPLEFKVQQTLRTLDDLLL